MDIWKLLYLKSQDGGGSGGDCQIKRIESLDQENLVNLRDLDSGHYNIYGYFSPYENSDIAISADNSLISVIWKNAGSHIICLDPLNAKIVFFEILVDETEEKGYKYTRTIIPLLDLHGLLASDGIIVPSSTAGSSKKFKLKVDDSGAISAEEVI